MVLIKASLIDALVSVGYVVIRVRWAIKVWKAVNISDGIEESRKTIRNGGNEKEGGVNE